MAQTDRQTHRQRQKNLNFLNSKFWWTKTFRIQNACFFRFVLNKNTVNSNFATKMCVKYIFAIMIHCMIVFVPYKNMSFCHRGWHVQINASKNECYSIFHINNFYLKETVERLQTYFYPPPQKYKISLYQSSNATGLCCQNNSLMKAWGVGRPLKQQVQYNICVSPLFMLSV